MLRSPTASTPLRQVLQNEATRQNGGHTNMPYSQSRGKLRRSEVDHEEVVEVHGPWNGLMSLPEIAAQFRQSLENGDD